MKKTAAQKAAAAGGNDMLCTIRNEALRAQIDTLGAQLMYNEKADVSEYFN